MTDQAQDLINEKTVGIYCSKCENHDHTEDCKQYCPVTLCEHDDEDDEPNLDK